MLIYNVKFMSGTSQKTGKPYEGYALEGVAIIQGEMRNDRAFVSSDAYNRCPVHPGDIAEIFRSGEIYLKAQCAFDVALIREALSV